MLTWSKVTTLNKNQVYLTAKLASELGCQRIFATRIVGPDYETEVDYENTNDENPNILSKKSALDCLDQLIKARDEFGIEVDNSKLSSLFAW